MLFTIAGMYIYHKYLKGRQTDEKNIPVVKITYYDMNKGKYIEIIERADKMPRGEES